MDSLGDSDAFGLPDDNCAARSGHGCLEPAARFSHPAVSLLQHTLASSIHCVGTGLHTGRPVSMRLSPAPVGSGIGFTRTDLPGRGMGQRDGAALRARYDAVIDTRLCTVIGGENPADRAGAVRVGTIEHLLAALAGAGVDNAVVEIDGSELPILDGSAAPFLFLIDCAGLAEQNEPASVIEVLRPVRVGHGPAWAELLPALPGCGGLDLELSIEFAAPAIGRQALALRLTPDRFRQCLAPARTFAQAAEIDGLRAAGLALGGSLDNAVVVDGADVLNPGGLRMQDEFVRHKLLDVVGDLALAGRLRGRFRGHCSGHALNNRVLRALMADRAAWRTAPATPRMAAAA